MPSSLDFSSGKCKMWKFQKEDKENISMNFYNMEFIVTEKD